MRLSDAATCSRDAVIERLFEARIGCSVHYIPLHLQPYWRDRYGLTAERFPHSQRAYERLISLPIYPRMDDGHVARVLDALAGALS